MSARGAQSRKVQQKAVEKKERKLGKSKANETVYEPHDGFADWRKTPSVNNPRNGVSRNLTVSSRTTSRSSSTNDSGSRPRLNTLYSNSSSDVRPAQSLGGGSASVSDVSTRGKDTPKFQANGKETKAPRGRGGGVPVKKPTASSPALPNSRAESTASYPSSSQKTWLNFKTWKAGKDGMRPYGGFEYDEDMSSGSVHIYFKEEQVDDEHPLPSIRAELDVLENSGSPWLRDALLYMRTDDHDDDWALPTSSESLMSPPHHSQYNDQSRYQRMLRPTSPGGHSPPPFDIDQPYDGISTRAASRLDELSDRGRHHQSNSSPAFQRTPESRPTHKIWFTAPEHITTAQGQRLHHVAIRNFLAMLHGKSIIGADLYDMLNTLQPQIEDMYMDFDNQQLRVTPRDQSIQMITNYLGQNGIDDVRNSIKSAMCLLAWSEQEKVRWRQGYLENFVHLAGVMIPELEEVPEFKRISIVTRRNLGIAAKALQLRVMEAEEKLAAFDFSDLWEDSSKVANSPVFQSYQAFRLFLISHYTRNFGNWPPATKKTWLNRKIALALQDDFGSLYDYLVNRDVIWNPREERASRKWEMAHRKDDKFRADVPELGITDLLVRFDATFGYSHIPHPYPLLPKDTPRNTKEKEKKSFFSSIKKDKSKDVTKDAKAHLQLSILFSDATNIEKLDVNFNGSTLIDKFEQFEMTTDLKHNTPREARLGRWVLIYGILQVLSTLSVDVQTLKYTDGVRYFLCTDLKRCPEWVTNSQTERLEASQKRSWCWQRSWDPTPIQTAPIELEASPSHERTHTPPDPAVQGHTTMRYDREMESGRDRATPIEQSRPLDFYPNPSSDNANPMPNDVHHINERITSLSLSPPARHALPQAYSRRHENEKSIQSDFPEWKPRLDSLPQPPAPTPATLYRIPERYNPDPNLTTADFDFVQPLPRPRETVTSLNTDLAGYPFSPEGMQWPVPPGYSELGSEHRESGIGYEVNGGGYGREGMAGGNAFLDVGAESGMDMGRGDWRSPRRMHERSGW